MREIDPDDMPAGTYLNTGEAARRGFRLNRFCYDLRDPSNRVAWEQDAEALLDRYEIDEEHRVLIRAHDWLGLVRHGANVFPLLRLSQLCGYGLAGTGAQMRGQTLEEYLSTRQARTS